MTVSLINLGLPAGDEQRLCLEEVTWQQYEALVSRANVYSPIFSIKAILMAFIEKNGTDFQPPKR